MEKEIFIYRDKIHKLAVEVKFKPLVVRRVLNNLQIKTFVHKRLKKCQISFLYYWLYFCCFLFSEDTYFSW